MGPRHQSLFVVAFCLLGLCINVKRIHVVSFLSSMDNGDAQLSLSVQRRRKKKIILFGPHDRFNFGDLLFEKVLSKLLKTRKNYTESDLIRAGLIHVNMSQFGGHPSIISIQRARELSRRDGGYHIIYTGGESMGCSLDRGLLMLSNNNASRQNAKRHSVSNCAYLLPKAQLVDNSSADNIVAIVNSVGGNYNATRIPGDCRLAVETADHVAFRDLARNTTHSHIPKATLRPDCAVLTSLLFEDTIQHYGNIGDVKHVRTNFANGYVAIQFKETDEYWNRAHEIAQILDGIYRKTNLTTVFFQAGSVPRHDSLALYRTISGKMTTPSFLFQQTHVWAVVAFIKYASAVLSTSLHVRIMAFIYARPRVTICPVPGKHDSFIDLWESQDATSCVDSLWNASHAITSAVTTSIATPPNATFAALERAMHLYLQGFEEWSSLLETADAIS